jgi:hypothetical protein
MVLLKRALLEMQEQIDWLLAGKHELTAVSSKALSATAPSLREQQLQRIAMLESEILAARAEIMTARADILTARAERDAVVNSASWRATSALRLVAAAMPVPVRRVMRGAVNALAGTQG